MPCSLCGEICRCSSALRSDESLVIAAPHVDTTASPVAATLPETARSGAETHASDESADAWRNEVTARLNRYHSRRKPRPPRYPSLQLQFKNESVSYARNDPSPEILSHASHHALALDGFPTLAEQHSPFITDQSEPETYSDSEFPFQLPSGAQFIVPAPTAKIIEFPRPWTPPTPARDELAEPVMAAPRILEVPEVVPPPPALGGITIEPAHASEIEKRPGIDFPLQTASLTRRILSSVVDATIIAASYIIFGWIFWKITALRPPRPQMVEIVTGLAASLWAVYQYLLVVYSGTTLGMRCLRLKLARFDGKPANRRLRRWRILASFLSAISLGMGYTWVFLDEDSLCWHDRITHTYLALKN
jgi:uncharacterized RDD family membrane protein YckC